jgi:hypothetical protein
MFILFSKGILEGTSGFVTRIHTRVSQLAHTGTMTGTHWHTLAHITGTHWHYQCVSYGDRKCSGSTAGREASVSDRVMPNEKWRPGGARLLPRAVLGVRDCCHAPSWGCEAAATRRPGGARLLPRAVSERAETSNMDEHCVDDTSKWLWHQS